MQWLPARFHITWQDDNTLRVDSDSGTADAALPIQFIAVGYEQPDVAGLFNRAVADTGVAGRWPHW